MRGILLGSLAGLLALIAGLLLLRSFFPIDEIDRVLAASQRHDLDPALTAAVIRWESRFRSDAVSSKGAIGLMQIMPETGAWIAERLGVPEYHPELLFDVETNLAFGTWYLRTLIDRFSSIDRALAAYNAGPSRVDAWSRGEGVPFPETERYVRRIRLSRVLYRAIWTAPHIYQAIPAW